jgi:hypothetical protein
LQSLWRLHHEAQGSSSIGQAPVIGDDRSQGIADGLCSGEVNGIEAPQLDLGRQACCAVE